MKRNIKTASKKNEKYKKKHFFHQNLNEVLFSIGTHGEYYIFEFTQKLETTYELELAKKPIAFFKESNNQFL